MFFSSHVVAQIERDVLVYRNEVLWPVTKAETEMRAQTSPWWVIGAIVHEVPAEDGILWTAETPEGSHRILSHTRDVPAHLFALLRQGLPIS